MKFINCIGDSLTFGARDEEHRSYPAELSKIYWEKEGVPLYCMNNGISGETSGELLKRIYANCKSCTEANVGLLLIGTNDTSIHTPPSIYEDNIRQILMVMDHFYSVLGIGILPPVYGPGLLSYPGDAQDQVDIFNDILINDMQPLYNFYADFRNMHDYIIDTVHFASDGYRKMAEIWYEALKRNGINL